MAATVRLITTIADIGLIFRIKAVTPLILADIRRLIIQEQNQAALFLANQLLAQAGLVLINQIHQKVIQAPADHTAALHDHTVHLAGLIVHQAGAIQALQGINLIR